MVEKIQELLKRLLFILVRVLEVPFALLNLILVLIISIIFFIQIRTIERAKRHAKQFHRNLEKLEGKVEWKKRKR